MMTVLTVFITGAHNNKEWSSTTSPNPGDTEVMSVHNTQAACDNSIQSHSHTKMSVKNETIKCVLICFSIMEQLNEICVKFNLIIITILSIKRQIPVLAHLTGVD